MDTETPWISAYNVCLYWCCMCSLLGVIMYCLFTDAVYSRTVEPRYNGSRYNEPRYDEHRYNEPDITTADLTNPDTTNPDLTNADITNPYITKPNIKTFLQNLEITNFKARVSTPIYLFLNPDMKNTTSGPKWFIISGLYITRCFITYCKADVSLTPLSAVKFQPPPILKRVIRCPSHHVTVMRAVYTDWFPGGLLTSLSHASLSHRHITTTVCQSRRVSHLSRAARQ